MNTISRRLAGFLKNKFGHCPRCMGLALWSAIVAWALVAAAIAWQASLVVTIAVLAVAGLLSALNLLHALFYALRSVSAVRNFRSPQNAESGHMPIPASSVRRLSSPLSRRAVTSLFLKAAGTALLASLALPRLARAACGDCANQFGSGYYDCITNFCNNMGQTCCPPGFPYLNHCDCLCYDTTEMDCGSYSNCLYCG